MGMKPLIYLDTCIVIYLVEEHPMYQPTIRLYRKPCDL
jgi:hypothetical protein